MLYIEDLLVTKALKRIQRYKWYIPCFHSTKSGGAMKKSGNVYFYGTPWENLDQKSLKAAESIWSDLAWT